MRRREVRPGVAWPWILIAVLASLALGVGATRLWNRPATVATAAAPEPGIQDPPSLVAAPAEPVPPAQDAAPLVRTSPPAMVTQPTLTAQAVAAVAADAPAVPIPPSQPPARRTRNQPPAPDLKLEGIVSSSTNPLAVINGSPVGVGEWVDGYRVLRITGEVVELERDGVRTTLRLR